MSKTSKAVIFILSGAPAVFMFFRVWKSAEEFISEHRLDPVAVGLFLGAVIGIAVWYFLYQYIYEKVEDRQYRRNKEKIPPN
jgi:formate hydrogenlyase subunit 3/multisubunit Na+/H+ antiporter MnhD subunit